ncbi:MAG: DNA-binding protein, partial [Lysobacter sp.]
SQQQELDALRLIAAEHQALQARWAEDTRTLETVRIELADVHTETTRERERREQAEADALRAGVRLETLEQLLTQLRPDSAKIEATTTATRKGRGRNTAD